ncbi:uncharacterized protein LAESUDRAFT_694399 [Laetiporus sulphureus 93-53]|uniref:DUF1771-domain-containing protein n=1 Tax=Laetiporus sulphureus 93-53 TaxID=1314785 RepID=A0A165G6U3_9APHY|nr:uncharacterized protein LAESUDRAFT_694399 [Laetiporus sulphureus 93-53]KZT09906.1 hypothetical protein LAESUDRAFT_694399 [Laetiporus sulphureus 93-53]
MLAPPTIAIPSDDIADTGHDGPAPSGHKFPHTRAQLSAIARQYKTGLESNDADPDADDPRVDSALVGKVTALLNSEREDDLKQLLKDTFGSIDEEEVSNAHQSHRAVTAVTPLCLEQHVLDLMHKHRDDVDNVPFHFLTPTRRPISRPSSRASTHSARLVPRPDTPNSAPSSPLAMIFRRPHTPLTSPLGVHQQATSYMTARGESPSTSPLITHAQFTASLPASPISSPRSLNAKASEFKPIQRPLSAASSNPGSLAQLRGDTPSPDLWGTVPGRPTSKLAITAPLMPESALFPRALTPSSSLRSSMRPDEQSDEEDPFDPFAASNVPRSFHPVGSESDTQWSTPSLSPDDPRNAAQAAGGEQAPNAQAQTEEMDPEAAAMLTDGMTPFDVLSSVFGATLAPSELEEALANNAYDFERAMTWLVDRQMNNPPVASGPPRIQSMGNRVVVVSREGAAGVFKGGRGGFAANVPAMRNGQRLVNGRPVPGGNRVCRYFLAGECLRADCRFSHDLERALCRFWLRGTCAKGENCEFLHHLPNDIDVSGLAHAMGRVEINATTPERSASPEDFPSLNHAANTAEQNRNGRGGYRYGPGNSAYDPGRTRFAAAVKRPAPVALPNGPTVQSPKDPALILARREAMGPAAEHPTTIVAPKPSPRIKLRPPTLLPTLPTGESISNLYMAYRSRALRLGAARNACLSRAADAWRRGDGAAAKRFSREGHDLNAKMSAEMVDAAGKLVRERARLAEQAVRSRGASWSDDYGDRTARGRICGANLGVCLGIASQSVGGEATKLTPEERTEVMLDLHGLHAAEATDVLEEFLLALEREHFYGLAYLVVGEEKHTGTQDPSRGASRQRLATGVREWLHMWGYPWSERDGVICVDPLTHG